MDVRLFGPSFFPLLVTIKYLTYIIITFNIPVQTPSKAMEYPHLSIIYFYNGFQGTVQFLTGTRLLRTRGHGYRTTLTRSQLKCVVLVEKVPQC